jgi:C1A family cysteine protease
MIYQTVAAALLVATAAAGTVGRLAPEDPSQQKALFDNFKKEHGRSYGTMAEEITRFENFLSNVRIADERNQAEFAAGGSAIHGITKFSDLTAEEFRTRFLGSDRRLKTKQAEVASVPPLAAGAASSVDWSGVLTTPVKDQGYCGSCWAFSATEQIESDSIRTLGQSTSSTLSPEQITQCDKTSFGCGGGWTEHAYDYVTKTGGLESNSDYPYTSSSGVTGTCHSDASKYKIDVTKYTTINGETNMANYMLATGPLSVCLDANNWNSYKGGIMTQCGKQVDHCVQAVGVDTSATNGYWKVRNSWGTSWGEAGYIRLAYGQNTCDITSDPTYTAVKKV